MLNNAKNNLTIVQNSTSLRHYPFEILDQVFLAKVESVKPQLNRSVIKLINKILKLLEYFLQITNKKLDFADLSKDSFKETVRCFVGALLSEKFINAEFLVRRAYVNSLFDILIQLQLHVPALKVKRLRVSGIVLDEDIKLGKYEFENTRLNEEKMYYWRGWWLENKTGKRCFANFISVYKRLGRDFTEQLYQICQNYFYSRNRNWIIFLPEFCKFLAKSDYLPCQLKDPLITMRFFQELLAFVMTRYFESGNNIRVAITHWRTSFIPFVEEFLIGEIFAEPHRRLPMPQSRSILGHETHIRKTPDGEEIKEKLLTDVPLAVSDTEAMEILFYQIGADINHIIKHALIAAEDTVERYNIRKALAEKGEIIIAQPIGTNKSNSKKANIYNFANTCATFEHYGFQLNGRDYNLKTYYPYPYTNTAYQLALPTSYALIPFLLLLIAEHPSITASFLDNLELYDKHGKQIGYVQMDKVNILVGYKKRRGSKDAQQTIILTKKSQWVVERLIELTAKARDYLKLENNDDWRYLLLFSGPGFAYPKRIVHIHKTIYDWKNKNRPDIFLQSLCKVSYNMEKAHVTKLIQRLNLSTLRASCGVQIYLKTRSVAKMSTALGHKKCNAQLIAHYLPEPIHAFFQSRWIRIFQEGIIVEALKESSCLLEATSFRNINELDKFLSHHALKLIPDNCKQNIENTKLAQGKMNQEIIFGVNTTILTIFVSLMQYVENASRPIAAKVKYWSEIGGYLINHIESKPELYEEAYEYLSIARKKANVFSLGGITYV